MRPSAKTNLATLLSFATRRKLWLRMITLIQSDSEELRFPCPLFRPFRFSVTRRAMRGHSIAPYWGRPRMFRMIARLNSRLLLPSSWYMPLKRSPTAK